jgi:hypothetical protein
MSRLSDPISAAALTYLAAPAFVFVLGWTEPAAGSAIAVLLAIALYALNIQLPRREFEPNASAAIYLVILGTLWAAFSGAGHFFYANVDWRTRDAVYADLILSGWPPGYGLHDGAPLVLRTAMGYFLPPAALAKLAGIGFAPTILFAWTALGVALFLLLLPLPRKFGWRLVLLGLVVVLFSGMDWPAIVLIHGHLPVFPLPLEWWRPWTYTSLTGQLFWAPNHALALWLGTALLFRHRRDPALAALGLVLLPILLPWTPFAVVGLLPWFLWAIARNHRSARSALAGTTPAQWLVAAALGTVLAALFSRPGVSVGLALPDPMGSATGSKANGIDLERISSYIQFVAFEFGLLVLLLRPRRPEARQALTLAAGILLLLPLIRLGPSNDWLLRVSTPSLLILLLLALAEFDGPLRQIRDSRRLVALLGVLALGAMTPLFEFSRAVLWPRTAPNYSQSLTEQQRGFVPPHYIGTLDHPALQALFRTPAAVPEAAPRQNLLPPAMRRPPS